MLLLVMRGLTYEQIGRRHGVSESAVRTHLGVARTRMGVSTTAQAAALMLREEWVTPDDVLPEGEALSDYEGAAYGSSEPRRFDSAWLPSPAQRLYLDAFDVLLRERSVVAAARVDFYFRALCLERGCPDRRSGRRDVGDMLLRVARGVARPLYDGLADAA